MINAFGDLPDRREVAWPFIELLDFVNVFNIRFA
tara:strand:- start:2501 stop:2602 length:102 start_codon:yes stop_codon:yes gene_type:complete